MSSKWRKKILYFLYVVVVVFVILIGFNIYFTYQIHNQIAKVVNNPGRWPAGAYEYDSQIGFDFSSNVSDYIRDGSFYVKSHKLGYRIGQNEDFASFLPGGILSLGCSFTYGDEIESELTFTQRIADSLGIAAYNYGVSSFSYVHALLKARKLQKNGILDELKPEYVLLGCWNGLLDRSRSPVPPLAKSIPLEAAHITKDKTGIYIHPPANFKLAFEIIELYRKTGTKMSFRKFAKLFFIAPEYLSSFLNDKQGNKKARKVSNSNNISDYEIYDYYFSGIEEVFSKYRTQIIVLYMPYYSFDTPDQALIDVLKMHPGIILVDGQKAVNRFNVNTIDYQEKHPQPSAHQAYALETIEVLSEYGD